MAPNVYASVTLVQPHNHTHNDAPIRLFGVIPVSYTHLIAPLDSGMSSALTVFTASGSQCGMRTGPPPSLAASIA